MTDPFSLEPILPAIEAEACLAAGPFERARLPTIER